MHELIKKFILENHLLTFSVMERLDSEILDSGQDSEQLDSEHLKTAGRDLDSELKSKNLDSENSNLNSENLNSENMGACQNFGVYSASCFYALDSENLAFLIKSDSKSRHIKLAFENPNISVCVATNTQAIRKIKGVQVRARFSQSNDEQKGIYYAAFPFARLGGGEIYALQILWAKYTDNSLLRSKKLEFVRA